MDVLDVSGLKKTLQKKISGMFMLDQVAIFLVGQIGRCDSLSGTKLSGSMLLEHCYTAILQANSFVGGRCILVECDNNEKLIKFYENNSFKKIVADDSKDGLVQMIKFIV